MGAMREATGPDLDEQRRRRRQAILVLVACAGATLAVVAITAWIAQAWLGTWQLPLLVAQAAIATFAVVRTLQVRAKHLDALHDTVAAAAPDGSVVTVVQGAAAASARFVGARALRYPFIVLVDDADGFGLWTARRGVAEELLWRPWSSVRSIGRRDDGYGVRLQPADDQRHGPLTLMPIGRTGSMADRMETPGRVGRFLGRLRDRHRAACPLEPGSEPVAREPDVDWLAPPDRTRPTRS